MKTFDELINMSDEEKLAYLKEEERKLIEATSPRNKLKLQSLSAKCSTIRRKYKHPHLSCLKIYELLTEKVEELKAAHK